MDQKNGDEPLVRCLPEREAPGGVRSEESAPFSPDTSSAGDAVSVVVFRIKREWFALRTGLFYQVADRELLHTIPGKTDRRFRGMVNVGGDLHLCFSLADILEIAEPAGGIPAEENRARLIVAGDEGNRFAFPVDEIMGVQSIFAAELETVLATPAGYGARLCSRILSIEGKRVGLLDGDKLLNALAGSLETDGNGTGK